MKKILLSLAVIATGFMAQSQVVCAGVTPANIAGNYVFEWADPGGGDWSCPDFLIPGTFVQAVIEMVEDGTAGTNPQGNPISQEGCFGPLTNSVANGNDLTGKIAVVYRNTCEFGYKALQAENAGAVGVIIINRDPEAIPMGGGAEGLNVTIPVVMVSSGDGLILTTEMANGPVEMFLGNKVGAYGDDIGANASEAMISPYGASNTRLDNGFEVGIQVYNFGANTQGNVSVTANIDGPSGNVYNQVINGPSMNTGDTLSIFTGNTYAFPPFDLGGVGSYPVGDYTLTYTLDMGIADESDFDNVLVSTFTVNDDMISLSNLDGGAMPISSNYPSNSTTEYQSCVFFEDANASALGVQGMYITAFADTALSELAGAQININIYEWNDTWVDLTDPNFPNNNDWFATLNSVVYQEYYPVDNSGQGVSVYVDLDAPFVMTDAQRYLFCLQAYDPAIGFGYNGALDYDGNQGITAMPVSPVFVDDTWYTGGWTGSSANSMGIKIVDPATIGLDEVNTVNGMAYPNPAKDMVTISIEATGNANLTVTDVAGKVAMNSVVTLVNGKSNVSIESLDAGVYIFNVELENGQTSQFNVVKK
jgi:PA domain/Secretion system C-terminal sorting domain